MSHLSCVPQLCLVTHQGLSSQRDEVEHQCPAQLIKYMLQLHLNSTGTTIKILILYSLRHSLEGLTPHKFAPSFASRDSSSMTRQSLGRRRKTLRRPSCWGWIINEPSRSPFITSKIKRSESNYSLARKNLIKKKINLRPRLLTSRRLVRHACLRECREETNEKKCSLMQMCVLTAEGFCSLKKKKKKLVNNYKSCSASIMETVHIKTLTYFICP